jgi:formylglycine-generating enzyme required for sulfatase activity
MKQLLQHPAAWCMLLSGVLLGVVVGTEAPANDEAGQLPKVEPIKHQAYTETIPNTDVKFDMVPIPGGSYLMGSPDHEPGHSKDEGPQHPVAVRPFWMGKCEVPWDEYDIWREDESAVIGAGKGDEKKGRKVEADAITRPTPPYADPTFGLGHDRYPAICMTQHAAMEYCRWLSKKTGKTYRLPTEAEWEWAARAGSPSAYFFGSNAKKLLEEYAWYKDNAEDGPHPVGLKKPNPWGLHDILGNVAEWCLDHYDKDYYSQFSTNKLALSPVLLPTEKRFPHVVRGGSYDDPAERCRSAARRGSDISWIKLDPQRPRSIWWLTSAEFVGFRVVRPVEEQENLRGLRSKVTRQSD